MNLQQQPSPALAHHHMQSVVKNTFQKTALTSDDELSKDNESKEAIASIKIT
jgi:hypothetical protein